MVRAAVYCRISQDRVGAGLGIARQREDCERLIESRSWALAAVYEDNDISAYAGRSRPGYERLRKDIADGHVDVVVAWHTDRLHRSPRELEDYITACDARSVATVTVRAGDLDLSTAAGRMVARMLGAAARHESEQKSERIRRARQQEALRGQVQGALGYGYRRSAEHPSGWEVHEPEAAIVREITSRLLAGESLGRLARDLNERHVPTPSGMTGVWRGGNIRQLVAAGRYCGWREYTPAAGGARGRGRGFGDLVAVGSWPPILTKETTEQLRLLLNDPSRRSGGRPGRATYLLSAGLSECGRCGAPLAGHRDSKRDVRRYVCVNQPGLKRCGRLTIAAHGLDEVVTAAVIEALASPDTSLTQIAASAVEPQLELDRLRQRLDELATLYGAGNITQAEWLSARRPITEQLATLEAQIRIIPRRYAISGVPRQAHELERYWANLSIEQQRAVVAAVLERVVVAPSTRAGNRVDTSRISLRWRA